MPARNHRAIAARIGPRVVVALILAIGVVSAAQSPTRTHVAAISAAAPTLGTVAGGSSRSVPSGVPARSAGQASLDGALGDGSEPVGATSAGDRLSGDAPCIPDPVRRGATRMPVPATVRFRPRDGWSGVSPGTNLSVRFTTAMDHASTERAFSAVLANGEPITGTTRWAEGDTVLVLDPATLLPRGARVVLAVATGALSSDGVALASPASVTFMVAAAPPPAPKTAALPIASTGWRWPLLGPITQYFGQSLTVYGFHQGIDIDGNTGDAVRAAHSGRVVVAGHYDGCGGLEVHIDHGGGVVSSYRHLSQIDVAVGATVEAGAVIGLVGETGCAFGSHLHFGVRVGTTFVDPLRYLPPR